jgi:competence protein ComGC
MNILLYLTELLQQHTTVGVAGVGTFSKKKFAGRYDKEKQSFLPPGYTLQFSPEVTETENLSTYISNKRNISKESTDYYIEQFAEEVSKKLETEHEAELENIGRLFYTEHSGLSFEPAKDINYGSEFFGLPSINEETPTIDQKNNSDDDDIYDEVGEAPSKDSFLTNDESKKVQNTPVIENIELDEVQDDLKNTLKHSPKQPEIIDVEHEVLNTLDSTEAQNDVHVSDTESRPETEQTPVYLNLEEDSKAELPITDAPEFIKEQHEEHPNRFGHQPESEHNSTYLSSNEVAKEELPVLDAPEFIKEQHAEHPNRFGHDPIVHEEPLDEEATSIWPKIWIGVIILVIVAIILFFAKPDLFKSPKIESKQKAVIDTVEVKKVDSNKLKQDSIAKTDSILKANQVIPKKDSVIKKTANIVSKTAITTFDVIGASYKTEKGAEKYIKIMKTKGYDAKIAKMSGPWKKVSIASFKTEKEAKEQKDILQKKLKGSGFYVQQINTTP